MIGEQLCFHKFKSATRETRVAYVRDTKSDRS